MKYILMMNLPKTGYDSFGAWSEKDIQANIAFVMGLNKALSESGEFVGAEGIHAWRFTMRKRLLPFLRPYYR